MPNPSEFKPPPSRNTGLMLALAAGLAVVLLGGGTVGAISYINATSDGQPTSAEATAEPSRPTSAPWESKAPAEETPAQEDVLPSGEPDDPASTPDSGTDGGTDSGTETGTGSGTLAHTDFDDWRFEFEGERFSAKKVGGWTYETCDPVDARGVLAESKCRRAVQVGYSAYRGHLRAVQVTMEFPSEQAAQNAARRMGQDDRALNIRRDMTLPDFAYGRVLTHPVANYVMTTIVTADKTAERRALKFHAYLHADSVTRFGIANRTVTT